MTVDIHGAVHATDTGRFTGHRQVEGDVDDVLAPVVSFLSPREMAMRTELAIANGIDPSDADFAELAAQASVKAAHMDAMLSSSDGGQAKLDEAFAILLHDGSDPLERDVTMRFLAERIVPESRDDAQVMAALAAYDSRAAYEYAPTPVYPVDTVGSAAARHVGRGVWATRCGDCGKLFTTNGYIVYDASLAQHRLQEHGASSGPLLPPARTA